MKSAKCKLRLRAVREPRPIIFHLPICTLNFAFFNIKEEPCPLMKRDAC